MALTPADIEQRTFSTALRGYDLDEVDDFLDEVVVSLRQLEERLEAAEKQRPPAPEAPVGSPVDEGAVGRALVAAQEAADRIVADARRDAEEILNEARNEADSWVGERERRKSEAEAEMARLTEHVAEVRVRLAALATEVADRLDEMDQAIEEVIGVEEEDIAQEGPDQETGEAGGDQPEESPEESGPGEPSEAAQPSESDEGDGSSRY